MWIGKDERQVTADMISLDIGANLTLDDSAINALAASWYMHVYTQLRRCKHECTHTQPTSPDSLQHMSAFNTRPSCELNASLQVTKFEIGCPVVCLLKNQPDSLGCPTVASRYHAARLTTEHAKHWRSPGIARRR